LASDPKKQDKLKAAITQDLLTSQSEELYHAIVLGMNSEDLTLWAKDIVSGKVNTVKKEMEIKKNAKKQRFFNRIFGGKEEKTEEQ